jgi:hypothetical protein
VKNIGGSDCALVGLISDRSLNVRSQDYNDLDWRAPSVLAMLAGPLSNIRGR